MNLLYQIKRSPFMSHDLDQVLIVVKAGSHIMLYQDGVMAAAESPVTREWLNKAIEAGVQVHALREDLDARVTSGDRRVGERDVAVRIASEGEPGRRNGNSSSAAIARLEAQPVADKMNRGKHRQQTGGAD